MLIVKLIENNKYNVLFPSGNEVIISEEDLNYIQNNIEKEKEILYCLDELIENNKAMKNKIEYLLDKLDSINTEKNVNEKILEEIDNLVEITNKINTTNKTNFLIIEELKKEFKNKKILGY